MTSIGKILLAVVPYVGAVGTILLVAWAVLNLRKIPQENKKDRGEAIKAVETYTEASKKLADRINGAPDLWEVWDAKSPATPEVERLMKDTYSLYHGIFMHRENGNFPDAEWDGAQDEMAHFLSYGYVQTNVNFADTLSPEFGKFMRRLTPKRIARQ